MLGLESFVNHVKYNSFNLSHDFQYTCDMGALVPALCKEVYPGDIWRCQANIFLRLIPQLAPFMHVVKVYQHWFFVPARLVNNQFETFISKGFSGKTVVPWSYIKAPAGGFGKYTVCDYMRLPVDVADIEVDAMPIRGYNFIVNEWYLNENLQTYINYSTNPGADTTTPYTLCYRNWQKDYFTSALPFSIRGDQVYLPWGNSPVVGTGKALGLTDGTTEFGMECAAYQTANYLTGNTRSLNEDLGGVSGTGTSIGYDKVIGVSTDKTKSNLIALNNLTGPSIDEVRVATRVSKWMQRNALNGVRYIELIKSHFNVNSSDARLDRPEYLGGSSAVIATSEVLQTSSTDSTSPQGNMSGHSFSYNQGKGITRRFEEHGYIYCMISILPRTKYQQGIDPMWSRKTPLDYYWPEFADLGLQPILEKELYATGVQAQDDTIFGFKPPYDELRHAYSGVAGDFRDTLDYWTMTRKFATAPQLNAAFVNANNVTKRIFNVTNANPCLVSVVFNIEALRKLPKAGVPGPL